jgi:adhesin transport system outer membrane protein
LAFFAHSNVLRIFSFLFFFIRFLMSPFFCFIRGRLMSAVSASACVIFLSGCSGISLPLLGCDDACDDTSRLEASTKDSTATAGDKSAANKGEDKPIVIEATKETGPFGALSPELFNKMEKVPDGAFLPRENRLKVGSLSEVIRNALKSNPQIGIAIASRLESEAAVNASRASLMPTLEISTASGQNTYGTFQTVGTTRYFDHTHAQGAWRSDLRMSSSYTLYDFGATRADIQRSEKARDAAALRSSVSMEDVAYSAAQLYLLVLQNRELLALAEENLVALKNISNLIETNVQNGNATQADMKRVEARVYDAESARADQELQLKSAIERFIRVVNMQPGDLRPPPSFEDLLPRTPASALDEAMKKNPQIKANAAAVAAARAEVDAFRANQYARVSVDGSAQNKNFRGQANKSEIDVSALLTLTYKIADGGLSNARTEQASARLTQAQLREVDGREALELDIRQQYLQFLSAKAKREGLLDGVKASDNARALYNEQFSGGKRTLLELLDVQSAYYSAKYNSIVNATEVRLTTFNILRSLGRLGDSLIARP